ncbi:MAG: pyridoxal phosphate-dependent aminotransferase [Pirellulales bacterium]
MTQIQTPMIPVVGEWTVKHPGTISLGQGVVHYAAPTAVHQAVAIAATSEPQIDRYALVRGLDELLEQIEQKVRRENGIDCRQQTCVVTAGSNMGFLNAIFAIGDVGDEIVLLSPYYFNHEMAIDMAGCKPVNVPTDANYQIDLSAVEAAITPKTRAIVTVSPCNPTGVIYTLDSLKAVNRLCRTHSIYHISDEAYEYFTYGERNHFSPASLPDAHQHTISLYTLSKAYGMAGWRCGYMAIPQHLEVAVKKIQDTNLICPPIVNQIAAIAAMKVGRSWCTEQIAPFERIRDLVLDELSTLGKKCRVPQPDGAFYALLQLDTNQNDLDLVKSLIENFGVAVMPGSMFGGADGCSLRIAYGALDTQTVAEGMGRLTHGLDTLL